jgi:nucleoside-diphosphate-sugar epimerase
MKVLVTGARGFLGSAVVERLLAHGEKDVRCFLRTGSDRSRLQALVAKHSSAQVEFSCGNLNSLADIASATEGVGTIYHLAAGMSGAPADLFLNTVIASKNLLEAVKDLRPLRIVLVSSFGVYGGADLPPGTVVDESTPLETRPEKRDPYSYAKLRQELLFREYQQRHGFELVVLRPGVVYGPRGTAFSSRVGLNVGGLFLHMGGSNLIPLSYVENCAEAIVLAGRNAEAAGQTYNVHDDGLPTSREYLCAYKKNVRRIHSVWIPYPMMLLISYIVQKYHLWSRGQLPAVFTPYKSATTWKGTRFDNRKLKGLGWRQLVSTPEGISRTFAYLKAQEDLGKAL